MFYTSPYLFSKKCNFPASIYLFKDNKSNTRKKCEIGSKLIVKIPERRRVFSVSFVDFEQINVGGLFLHDHINHYREIEVLESLGHTCRACYVKISDLSAKT